MTLASLNIKQFAEVTMMSALQNTTQHNKNLHSTIVPQIQKHFDRLLRNIGPVPEISFTCFLNGMNE